MGTTLTGTTPQDTYDSLIKVTDNGPLSGTAKYLSDGLGNDSTLALSTGNIGIGTTSPAGYAARILDIGGAASVSVNFHTTGTGATQNDGATMILASDNSLRLTNYETDGVLRFETQDTERMRITAAGNVGIGTSSPTGPLEVVLPARTSEDINAQHATFGSGTSGNGVKIGFNSANNIGYVTALKPFVAWCDLELEGASIRFAPSGTERVRVTTDGLTFNGDTAAANALDDYEEGTFTPTVVYSTSGAPTYAVQLGRYTKIGRTVQVQIYLSFNENGAVGNVSIAGLPFTSVNSTSRAIASIFSFGLTGVTSSVTGFVNSNATTIALFLNDNAATVLSSTYTDSDQDIYVTVTYEAA